VRSPRFLGAFQFSGDLSVLAESAACEASRQQHRTVDLVRALRALHGLGELNK